MGADMLLSSVAKWELIKWKSHTNKTIYCRYGQQFKMMMIIFFTQSSFSFSFFYSEPQLLTSKLQNEAAMI